MCLVQFLHPLENEQDLLARTPPGTGGPPTIFNNEHSKISLKFSVVASSRSNSAASGSNH